VDPRQVASLLQKVQAGEIVANYGGGGGNRRASMEGRKSIDGGARPPSIDMGSSAQRRSLDRWAGWALNHPMLSPPYRPLADCTLLSVARHPT
jgi:hypothetical protein